MERHHPLAELWKNRDAELVAAMDKQVGIVWKEFVVIGYLLEIRHETNTEFSYRAYAAQSRICGPDTVGSSKWGNISISLANMHNYTSNHSSSTTTSEVSENGNPVMVFYLFILSFCGKRLLL